ncbi:class I SAM-dependent methyltransferase [Maridesulfovibrio salexigens]|uniref:Methyltransferase type 12 n=1 Tax=Maridesulfovibrio salexigens (strain ATCC 14822 / DSM 2638 / NCIMB 8403 / VKM B-1763) TaxID=526222 RepID=C6BTH2_MARSD|nr:class I SAM-dependent methyltransferase [Maridesulfovibrio salexigens]ACS81653.1 Methyltransferase type 12 [Maridesulfovibrio salexigens DSM 2638]
MNSELDKFVISYEGGREYDFDNKVLLNWYPRRVAELCNKGGSLLELGLGHGYTSPLFSKIFDEHVVVEGSSAVIDNFHRRNPNTEVEIINALFEDFETDKKYDVIIFGFILEHLEDPVLVLKRFKKFLVDGGRIFVSVPNALSMNRRLGNYAGFLDDIYKLTQNDLDLGHKKLYSVESLKQEMNDAGYVVERMEGLYLKPFTTAQILSLNLDDKVIEGLCKIGIDYPELCCGLLAEGRIDV